MTASTIPARSEDQEWRYANAALSWYGWGSPIGAGIFLVCIAAAIALLRYAIFG
ncbi:MAG TPA: hypothetical protein VG894_10010 [Bauldia sp.]|nr:hypothetical protein [Bauldia sp.]